MSLQKLLSTLVLLAGLWITSQLGRVLADYIHTGWLQYDSTPVALSIYYLCFAYLTMKLVGVPRAMWSIIESKLSFILALGGSGGVVWCVSLVWTLLLPPLRTSFGIPLEFTTVDFMVAGSVFVLPKTVELIVQQILIALVIEKLYAFKSSMRFVRCAYAGGFALVHVFLFFLFPWQLAVAFILAASISGVIFPQLILFRRLGMILTFGLHWIFYCFMAVILLFL